MLRVPVLVIRKSRLFLGGRYGFSRLAPAFSGIDCSMGVRCGIRGSGSDTPGCWGEFVLLRARSGFKHAFKRDRACGKPVFIEPIIVKDGDIDNQLTLMPFYGGMAGRSSAFTTPVMLEKRLTHHFSVRVDTHSIDL